MPLAEEIVSPALGPHQEVDCALLGPMKPSHCSRGATPPTSSSSGRVSRPTSSNERSVSALSPRDDDESPFDNTPTTTCSSGTPHAAGPRLGESKPKHRGACPSQTTSPLISSSPPPCRRNLPSLTNSPQAPLAWQYEVSEPATWELAALTCFNFPYGFVCSTMGIVILPQEAAQLMPASAGDLLAFALFLVGFSQLVCPLAGKLSDDLGASTPLGRRRPFILAGWLIGALACLAMWHASAKGMLFLYVSSLFLSMVGLNIVYSVQCCMIADLVPESLHGKTSGMVAVHAVSGSQIGFGLLILTSYIKVAGAVYIYPLMVALISVSCCVQLAVGHRLQRRSRSSSLQRWDSYAMLAPHASSTAATPAAANLSEDAETAASTAPPRSDSNTPLWTEEQRDKTDTPSPTLTLRQLPQRLRKWSDFILVFCSRTCYYIAISCQAYMLYYMRDVIGTTEVMKQQKQLGIIVFLAQGTAAALAFPFGRLADREGVSKKILIYFACGMMSFVYGWFLVAPHFGEYAYVALLPVAIMYGIGNGCFLAVDYALALATTPDRANSGKALGLWGVSFFIGASLGPTLWSRAIVTFGSTAKSEVYSFDGYVAMLTGGMAVTVASGVLVAFVKSVK